MKTIRLTNTRLVAALVAMLTATTVVVVGISPGHAATIVTCAGHETTHHGTTGDDLLYGTDDADVIAGLGGKDTIYGLGGDDIICGGSGKDRIRGGAGNDLIYGNGGKDVLRGNGGKDIIKAGPGNDRAYGNSGSGDVINGKSGVDLCIAEKETDCELDYFGKRDVEEWRDLVDVYFGAIGQTNNALEVMDCESQGDPFAVGPGTNPPLGLFQHLKSYWPGRATNAGFPGFSAFHPEANIAATRWLYDNAGGWWPSWGGCAP